MDHVDLAPLTPGCENSAVVEAVPDAQPVLRSALQMTKPRTNLPRVYSALFRYFRPRRLRLFYRLFGVHGGTRILDLGGGRYFWELASAEGLPVPRVTVVNVDAPAERPAEFT